MDRWLSDWLQFLIVMPAAVSCYLVMRGQLRFRLGRTVLFAAAGLLSYSLLGACLTFYLGLDVHLVVLVSLAPLFFLYRYTLTCDLSKCLAVFVGVCAMQTFSIQFAIAFDAVLHPQAAGSDMSLEAALFELGISALMAGAFAWPEIRWFHRMVDQLNIPRVWYATVLLSALFLAANTLAMPQFYSTLQIARIPSMFPVLEGFALTVLLLIYLLFFYGTSIILENVRLRERGRLLEMQSRQYEVLLEQVQETSRLRHDFRHSLRLLGSLAEAGDVDSIRNHLAQYAGILAETAPVRYCGNAALNALFSHYSAMAAKAGIQTQWKIELPDPLPVAELDLASLFGNLMENAIDGCESVPEKSRYFCLTSEIQHGSCLYIVSTNSFDGEIRKDGSGYASTKHPGSGLGLASIQAIAEKYGGFAQFSWDGTEFYVDIQLLF